MSVAIKMKPLLTEPILDPKKTLESAYLDHIIQAKKKCTVFLLNGVKLQGILTWFDATTVLLQRESHNQLLYKHAISTVMPDDAIVFSTVIGEQVYAGRYG